MTMVVTTKIIGPGDLSALKSRTDEFLAEVPADLVVSVGYLPTAESEGHRWYYSYVAYKVKT